MKTNYYNKEFIKTIPLESKIIVPIDDLANETNIKLYQKDFYHFYDDTKELYCSFLLDFRKDSNSILKHNDLVEQIKKIQADSLSILNDYVNDPSNLYLSSFLSKSLDISDYFLLSEKNSNISYIQYLINIQYNLSKYDNSIKNPIVVIPFLPKNEELSILNFCRENLITLVIFNYFDYTFKEEKRFFKTIKTIENYTSLKFLTDHEYRKLASVFFGHLLFSSIEKDTDFINIDEYSKNILNLSNALDNFDFETYFNVYYVKDFSLMLDNNYSSFFRTIHNKNREIFYDSSLYNGEENESKNDLLVKCKIKHNDLLNLYNQPFENYQRFLELAEYSKNIKIDSSFYTLFSRFNFDQKIDALNLLFNSNNSEIIKSLKTNVFFKDDFFPVISSYHPKANNLSYISDLLQSVKNKNENLYKKIFNELVKNDELENIALSLFKKGISIFYIEKFCELFYDKRPNFFYDFDKIKELDEYDIYFSNHLPNIHNINFDKIVFDSRLKNIISIKLGDSNIATMYLDELLLHFGNDHFDEIMKYNMNTKVKLDLFIKKLMFSFRFKKIYELINNDMYIFNESTLKLLKIHSFKCSYNQDARQIYLKLK